MTRSSRSETVRHIKIIAHRRRSRRPTRSPRRHHFPFDHRRFARFVPWRPRRRFSSVRPDGRGRGVLLAAVARLITPMLAAYFLAGAPMKHAQSSAIMRGTSPCSLRRCAFRWSLKPASCLLCGPSMRSASLLRLHPARRASRIVISLELRPASQASKTTPRNDRCGNEVDAHVPEVETVYVIGGASPGTPQAPRDRVAI